MAGEDSEGGGTGGNFVATTKHPAGQKQQAEAEETGQMLENLRQIVEAQR